MTNFKKILDLNIDNSPFPEVVEYKGKEIFGFDRFPIKNLDILIVSIEKTSSKFIQGLGIGVFDGYLKVKNKRLNKRKYILNLFFEDSEELDIKNMGLKVFTKGDHIIIQNIWEIDVEGWRGHRFKRWGTEMAEVESGYFKHDEPKKEPCYFNDKNWKKGSGNGAAMYSEDIPGGRRYFCNNDEEKEGFDNIIFTVTRKDGAPVPPNSISEREKLKPKM